jgi:hypothetical protein
VAGSFFHQGAWLDALAAAYPAFACHHALALGAGDEVLALTPLFEVRSALGGRRLTTQPFNFYGGPLGSDEAAVAELVAHAARIARERRARVLDVRTLAPLAPATVAALGLVEAGQYVRHVVPLASQAAADPRARYAARFRSRLRALERASSASGPRELATDDDVRALHRLLVAAYARKHGTLAQPLGYFRALRGLAGEGGTAVRFLGWVEGERLVAALVLGDDGRRVAYLHGGALPGAEASSPLARLLDHALVDAARRGREELDLGLTSRAHEGLAQAKRALGGEERPLWFYRAALAGRLGPAPDYHSSFAALRPLVRVTPPRLAALASRLVARWLA